MNLEIIHNFEKFLGNKGYSPQTIRTYTKALEQGKRKIASTLTFLGGCFAATDI